jgi:ABC-type multidrug transport system ATPase subunit
VIFLEIVPGFALYRGLYEIAQYAFRANYQGGDVATWSTLGDPNNGLAGCMAIFAAEAVLFLAAAWYLEQVAPAGVGVPRHPLFCLGRRFAAERRRAPAAGRAASVGVEAQLPEGAVGVDVGAGAEPADVAEERRRVEALAGSPGGGGDAAAILIRDLNKVFPGRAKKVAVRDLTMAVARGECFGLLGPNGAGKSTTINLLTGFLTPSRGTALVQGHDIRAEMDRVYGAMGVCPQDNLLWERLTAREHLLFYGRLKNLAGAALGAAVEAALRGVNLLNGGVADKQVRTFSGGMKRRLSVAISLIGDPLVVYLDEPSTGLDPASRQNLWDVVKAAKPGRGIILTTHSMEEAAVLCDRLGIFVGGQLVCVGAPKELTARYGDYLVFTITTPPEQEAAAEALVRRLSPGARLTYSLAGTRRYELPVGEVSLSGVFEAMEAAAAAAGGLTVLDWGVANATLEEVFIKFAKSIGAEGGR